MDTRTWRLASLRNAEIIEVDHERVLQAKSEVLCEVRPRRTARGRVAFAVDLRRGDWAERLAEFRVPLGPVGEDRVFRSLPGSFGFRFRMLVASLFQNLGAAFGPTNDRAGGGVACVARWFAQRLQRLADTTRPTAASELRGAGTRKLLERGQPLCVVMEGLLMYLSGREVRRLLRKVGRLSDGPARVCASLVNWQSVRDARSSESKLLRSWKWGCDREKAKAFFEKALGPGWTVLKVDLVGEDVHYGVWAHLDFRNSKRKGQTLYVVAERQQR
mmetsp:Transcript_7274/g.27718  ORF Transcript_7274/g.27718 Transcript_7274/m.27718 type:complete len:274 (-) Transcript_7274:167-988(-)